MLTYANYTLPKEINMEIERKYLFNTIPFDLKQYPCNLIEQVYISTTPVIRARKKAPIDQINGEPSYILTIKSSGLLKREEYELLLTEDEYLSLLRKAEGNVITKKRYVIPLHSDLNLELDIFEGTFKGLIMGEIEFPSDEAANKYNPPEYISREVTFDTHFHNSTMSHMSESDISDLIKLAHTN